MSILRIRDASGRFVAIPSIKGDKGDKGDAGSVTAVNGRLPDSGGNVKLGAVHPANLLDNSDFRNPVNQRGQTSYSGEANKDVYTIDRWLFSWQADGRITLGDGYITKEAAESAAESGATYAVLTQKIDEKLIDGQKTYTAALMMADGTLYVYSGKPANGFGDWDNSIWVGYPYENPAFQIRTGLSGNMLWAALYEGEYTADTLPPYVPKGYAAELAECRRYYIDFGDTIFRSTKKSDTMWALNVQLPTNMRVIPTVEAAAREGVYPDVYLNVSKNGISWYLESEFTLIYVKAYADL